MENKPTKYFSSLQERRISEYLGWNLVAGSGSKPLNPGDIRAADWLAECKTHTEQVDKITIRKMVWVKIATEAKATMRRPALFIDDGTQKIDHTWAVIPQQWYNRDIVLCDLPRRDSLSKITVEVNSWEAKTIGDRVCRISIENQSLLLMRISTFKSMLDGDGIGFDTDRRR